MATTPDVLCMSISAGILAVTSAFPALGGLKVLYLDETHALRPLHVAAVVANEVPETYPTGV